MFLSDATVDTRYTTPIEKLTCRWLAGKICTVEICLAKICLIYEF